MNLVKTRHSPRHIFCLLISIIHELTLRQNKNKWNKSPCFQQWLAGEFSPRHKGTLAYEWFLSCYWSWWDKSCTGRTLKRACLTYTWDPDRCHVIFWISWANRNTFKIQSLYPQLKNTKVAKICSSVTFLAKPILDMVVFGRRTLILIGGL